MFASSVVILDILLTDALRMSRTLQARPSKVDRGRLSSSSSLGTTTRPRRRREVSRTTSVKG